MDMVKYIYKSIFSPLEVITGKEMKGRVLASAIVVVITAFFGSVLAPALFYLNNKNKYELSIDVKNLMLMFLVSVLTWLAACMLFWLLSLFFKKNVGFAGIVSTWGFSYVPNLVCVITYSLIQMKFGFFTSNVIIGFLVNTFFIMLLVWKVIYYFIEMKFVIGTTGYELCIISLVSGIVFMFLMWIGFSLGIQIPIL